MKNIVLLITDTFRYDNLGDRAKRPIRTPELDKFAAERATEITRFYTGSFPTIPHRTDVAQGVLGWPNYGWQPISQSGPNHVGRILGKAGYVSQLICDCPHLFNAGFQQGFTAAFQHRGQEGDKPLLHLNDPIERSTPLDKTRKAPMFRDATLADQHRWTNRYYKTEDQTFQHKTSSTAARWLEENNEAGPFFLWVDMFDPHEPWDAPEYLVKRYDPSGMNPPMTHPNYGPSSDYTDEELTNLWAHYAAESELVDRGLGRILQKIEDLELWDDTIVIVTSDHGVSLGEHERTGKTNISDHDERYWPIYPEIGHVPFLIAGGDIPRGKTVDFIAQPIDILPTAMELAGVSADPPTPFHGKPFASILLAGKGSHRDVAVSGNYGKHDYDGARKIGEPPFVVNEKWGYTPMGSDGSPELYDLATDPLAEKNVADANPDAVAEMHGLFISHLEAHDTPDELLSFWKK